MSPLFQSAGQWAVLGLSLISTAQAIPRSDSHVARQSSTNLRLMPLGASITFGVGSSDGNGYRQDLRDLLRDDGYTVDMVGSHQGGDMDDPDNEGWSGARVDEVQGHAEASVPDLQPNLFTINAGTNDCAQDHDVDSAGDRMGDLLESLWAASPGSTVVLSTLLINLADAVEECVVGLNAQYSALADQKQADGKKVVLADMHSDAGPQEADMYDDTHPTDAGYVKMADIWLQGIQDAASRGWITEPN